MQTLFIGPLQNQMKYPYRKFLDILWILTLDMNMDLEENSSYQEGVILQMNHRLDRSYFKEPPELDSLISTSKLVQKSLLKQANIDKMLKIIQRKVLKGTHLPVTVKEIQAGYLISPYFKD